MQHIYGYFKDEQMDGYKAKLHNEIFWLLLYKDPKTKDNFPNVDFEKYFDSVMRKLNGLNELLFYPTEIVELMSMLEAALIESRNENFNFQAYRKLVLDSHALVDKIGG